MTQTIGEYFFGIIRFLKRLFLFLFIAQLVYIVVLTWIDAPITLTQLGNWINGKGLKRDYINYNEMGVNARLAVIASEDQLFADHDGFDFKSIQKAMKHNQKSKSLKGASTISQQVAKNIFLWQGRSWFRKGLEIYFTFMIELLWSKQRILEHYLNISEMGPGVFGIEAAAKYYFKKSADKLTRQEAAKIAACLPNPKEYTIKPLSSHVAQRYLWVLQQMNNICNDEAIQEIIYTQQNKDIK
jgi:monofunctional biosynthetic peptidoglycan transglycosylase